MLVVDGEPALEARRRDAEVLRDLGHGRVGVAEDPDHVLAELLGKRLRHGAHSSSVDTRRRRSDVTYGCSSPLPRAVALSGAVAVVASVGRREA